MAAGLLALLVESRIQPIKSRVQFDGPFKAITSHDGKCRLLALFRLCRHISPRKAGRWWILITALKRKHWCLHRASREGHHDLIPSWHGRARIMRWSSAEDTTSRHLYKKIASFRWGEHAHCPPPPPPKCSFDKPTGRTGINEINRETCSGKTWALGSKLCAHAEELRKMDGRTLGMKTKFGGSEVWDCFYESIS